MQSVVSGWIPKPRAQFPEPRPRRAIAAASFAAASAATLEYARAARSNNGPTAHAKRVEMGDPLVDPLPKPSIQRREELFLFEARVAPRNR